MKYFVMFAVIICVKMLVSCESITEQHFLGIRYKKLYDELRSP
jgi:hypothetical protein